MFEALILHGGTLITLLVWQPDPNNSGMFYLFAVLWGIGDAVIQTLVNGKYNNVSQKPPYSRSPFHFFCD